MSLPQSPKSISLAAVALSLASPSIFVDGSPFGFREPKSTYWNTHCAACDKEIPKGRAGRKCKECRAKQEQPQ